MLWALLAGGAAARALARRAGDGEAHVLGVPDGGNGDLSHNDRASPSSSSPRRPTSASPPTAASCSSTTPAPSSPSRPSAAAPTLPSGTPQAWRPEFTEQLEGAGRFQPVTLPSLLRDGATHFCWLNAGEELKAGDTSWMPSKEGAFLYRRKDAGAPSRQGRPPILFPLKATLMKVAPRAERSSTRGRGVFFPVGLNWKVETSSA